MAETFESPFGYGVRDVIGEMQRGEGVQAFDVSTLADSGHAGPVTSEMLGVDSGNLLPPNFLLRGPHPAR